MLFIPFQSNWLLYIIPLLAQDLIKISKKSIKKLEYS